MNNNIINQVAYIKSSREFPPDLQQISMILTRTYIEIANAINDRTIGLFPTTRPAITGNAYFLLRNQKQQSFRQVYTFTSTADIPHNINTQTVSYVSAMYGQFTDGINWYGLIAGTTVPIPGQISFYLSPSTPTVAGNIKFVVGAGAPVLSKGIIVLEWISQP